MKGVFIVFEGVDGSGKSTQIKHLSEHLQCRGYTTYLTREPSDAPIGRLIRTYSETGLRTLEPATEALLFAADRTEHTKEITSHLEEGTVVICDRYIHSSLTYQGAVGVDRDWIKGLNKAAITPDLVILLDIDPGSSLDRVTDRSRTVFEEDTYLRRVRGLYLEYAEKGELVTVDASGELGDIQAKIRRLVDQLLD